MEPLIATDWLKDYDPLFDLFDEEMRCSSSTQSGMGADYFNEYDLNNNYYNPCYKQTDELSLILGLEWMPCLDLNSPSTSSSSSLNLTAPSSNTNSQANSQCPSTSPLSASSLSSSSSSTTTTTSSQSSPIVTNIIDNKQTPHNSQPNTTQSAKTTTLSNNSNKINNNNSTGQQEQRLFRIQLQNDVSSNKLGASNSINSNSFSNSSDFVQSPGANGANALKQKSCLVVNSNNNLIASSLVDTTTQIVSCANVNLKRKKKFLKTKGTSLLAQPSPKSANNSTSSSSASTKTSNKTIMPTLITINRPATIMTPLQQQQQQVLPKTTTLLSTTTTLTNRNNQITPLTYIANGTTAINNNNNNNNLTRLDRTMRYCIKIEHAYSSMMC